MMRSISSVSVICVPRANGTPPDVHPIGSVGDGGVRGCHGLVECEGSALVVERVRSPVDDGHHGNLAGKIEAASCEDSLLPVSAVCSSRV
jgi:hypothetical protein